MNADMNADQQKEMSHIITEAKKIVDAYPDKEHFFYMAFLAETNKLYINICDLTGVREEYGKEVSDIDFHGEVIKNVSKTVRETEGLKDDSPIFVVIYKRLKEISNMQPQDIHNIIFRAFNQPVDDNQVTH